MRCVYWRAQETAMENKLDVLRKRKASVEAAIAAEQVKRKRREWKEYERLKSIIGGALLANAVEHPDFDLLLKGVLKGASSIVEGDKKLLRAKGWL